VGRQSRLPNGWKLSKSLRVSLPNAKAEAFAESDPASRATMILLAFEVMSEDPQRYLTLRERVVEARQLAIEGI
jgi:hypothetical protein